MNCQRESRDKIKTYDWVCKIFVLNSMKKDWSDINSALIIYCYFDLTLKTLNFGCWHRAKSWHLPSRSSKKNFGNSGYSA